MPDIKWIKITTEMFDDEKIRIIERMPEADTLLVIWIRLICLAGKVNAGGHIFLAPDLPYNDEQLAAVFNRELNTVRLALQTFQRLKMLNIDEDGHIFLPKFEVHQNIEGMQRTKELAADRQKKFRQREKVKLLNAGVKTDSNVTVTLRNDVDKTRLDNKEEKEVIYNNVLTNLKSSVNALNFKNYYERNQLVEIYDNAFVIAAPNEQVAKYLEENAKGLIEKAVFDVTGENLELKIVLGV